MGAGVLYPEDNGEEIFRHVLGHPGIGYDVKGRRGVGRLVIIEPLHDTSLSEHNLDQFYHGAWRSRPGVPEQRPLDDVPLGVDVHVFLVVRGAEFRCQHIKHGFREHIDHGHRPGPAGVVDDPLDLPLQGVADTLYLDILCHAYG